MQLIPPPTTPSTPQAPTPAELVGKDLVNAVQSGYRQLCRIQKDGIDLLWHNKRGLTPTQVAELADTNGAAMLAFHGGLTDLIVAVATQAGVTPDIKLPTNSFTINQDGTVTILEEPYLP